ncbi:aminoglycoside phosphotransferase family protein [Nocardioides sp. YIM 152588]|uniref:phosphotransferase family protein n=1 Tax=Nocardioides sp. YIM 152588 TaxID=3158259 RepID=UPI0032E4CBE1
MTTDVLGEPLATGRSALVYAWPDHPDRVVKVFPPAYPDALVDAELAASTEAARLVANVLPCHGRVQVDGLRGLVFDRLHGDSLTRQAERNPLRVRSGARVLAREHATLHDVATERFQEVRAAAVAALDSAPMEFLSPEQRAAAAAMIVALPAGDRLLHMDFHTENVFAHGAGHVVIDWQTTLRGSPAADVAATVLLLRDAELWPGTPWLKRVLVGFVRRTVLDAYLGEYRRRTGMTMAEIDAWRVPALVLRIALLDIDSERDRFRSELLALIGAR